MRKGTEIFAIVGVSGAILATGGGIVTGAIEPRSPKSAEGWRIPASFHEEEYDATINTLGGDKNQTVDLSLPLASPQSVEAASKKLKPGVHCSDVPTLIAYANADKKSRFCLDASNVRVMGSTAVFTAALDPEYPAAQAFSWKYLGESAQPANCEPIYNRLGAYGITLLQETGSIPENQRPEVHIQLPDGATSPCDDPSLSGQQSNQTGSRG